VSEAAPPTAAQTGLNVVVQHGLDGVVIHVSGTANRQGGIDTESVVAFLSALDAEQLEKDVLTGLGTLEGDGEESFTKSLLARLIVIAKGEW
jgi:hypothetical protein